jgi:hypothetical protein
MMWLANDNLNYDTLVRIYTLFWTHFYDRKLALVVCDYYYGTSHQQAFWKLQLRINLFTRIP